MAEEASKHAANVAKSIGILDALLDRADGDEDTLSQAVGHLESYHDGLDGAPEPAFEGELGPTHLRSAIVTLDCVAERVDDPQAAMELDAGGMVADPYILEVADGK